MMVQYPKWEYVLSFLFHPSLEYYIRHSRRFYTYLHVQFLNMCPFDYTAFVVSRMVENP